MHSEFHSDYATFLSLFSVTKTIYIDTKPLPLLNEAAWHFVITINQAFSHMIRDNLRVASN